MICDLYEWWELLTYYGLKYNLNVTDGINLFSEEKIKVGNEEDGTSTFNQACDKYQANQDMAQTSQLLDMA